MPRPRIYDTNAERQRAFRARRKAELEELRELRARTSQHRRRPSPRRDDSTPATATP